MDKADDCTLDADAKRRRFLANAIFAWADFELTGLHATGEEADEWLGRLEAGENAPVPLCHR